MSDKNDIKKEEVKAAPVAEGNDELSKMIAEVKESLKAEMLPEITKTVTKTITDEMKKKSTKVYAGVPREVKEFNITDYCCAVAKTGHASHLIQKQGYDYLLNKYGTETEGKDMSVGTNTAGGYFVPPQFTQDLISVMPFETVLYDRVTPMQMDSVTDQFPVLDQVGASPSSGTDAFGTGLSVGQVSEGSAPGSETELAIAQVTLHADDYMAFTDLSNKLIEKSNPSIMTILAQQYGLQIQGKFDYDCFHGNNDVVGLIGHAASLKVTRKTLNSVDWTDLVKMWSRFHPRYLNGAIWVMHPYIRESLVKSQSTNGQLVFMPNGVNGAPVPYFLGLPIVGGDVCPAIGTEADVILINPQIHYGIGEFRAVQIDASSHVKFKNDQTTVRIKTSRAGKPWFAGVWKLRDGTSTVSTCVVLDDLNS